MTNLIAPPRKIPNNVGERAFFKELVDSVYQLFYNAGGQNAALQVQEATTTERDDIKARNGMIIYNTTTNAFNFYENGAWVSGSGLA